MSSEETETHVVGNYLIVSTISHCYHAGNPLKDDEYAGELHGNFCRYGRAQFGSMGTELEFYSARGACGPDDDLEIEDYINDAAILVALETPYEEALEVVLKEWEFPDEERADETYMRAEVHRLFSEYVVKEAAATYCRLPSDLEERLHEKARILARTAIEARMVGDKYAVPMSLSGYNEMYLEPDLHKSFVDLTKSDTLWIPGKLNREELDALPYAEAMVRAVEFAKCDGEQYAHWASGNVFEMDVKVYLMEWDDDCEEFIEEADHYDGEETVWEDSVGYYFGRDHADKELAQMEENAKAHITELQAALSASQATSSMSMAA